MGHMSTLQQFTVRPHLCRLLLLLLILKSSCIVWNVLRALSAIILILALTIMRVP